MGKLLKGLKNFKGALGLLFFIPLAFWLSFKSIQEKKLEKETNEFNQTVSQLKKKVGDAISLYDHLPSELTIGEKEFEINYTLDPKLQNFVESLVRKYKTFLTSAVVIDNNTGKILSLYNYSSEGGFSGVKHSLAATHPAASLIKVVTAADLLAHGGVSTESQFVYKGRASTLYKHQLEEPRDSRWTRVLTFAQAFALSNNVIFGKAAINKRTALGIHKTAEDFYFNRPLFPFLYSSMSIFPVAENQYNLAELASGLNRETLISPLHAALLASVVANEGIALTPRLVESAIEVGPNKDFWVGDFSSRQVLSQENSRELSKMMTLTIEKGTARKSFRELRREVRNHLEIGGKTGSITGGLPHGKRDWFIAYAKPHSTMMKGDSGISVAVMIVNEKKWYIRSTFLAKNIIEYYYQEFMKPKLVQLPLPEPTPNEI